MKKANPSIDAFIIKSKKWNKEFILLRTILNEFDFIEELKWGVPCYSLSIEKKTSNVVLMHGFKEYCALLFFKGALFNDPKKILIQQTKNVQATRQLRFTSENEIIKLKPQIISLVKQAIVIEKSGKKVEFKKTSEFDIATEFQNKLKTIKGLKIAFNKLTPGRQRAYLLFFSAPKQAKTRETRIDKYLKHILNGKGLHD